MIRFLRSITSLAWLFLLLSHGAVSGRALPLTYTASTEMYPPMEDAEVTADPIALPVITALAPTTIRNGNVKFEVRFQEAVPSSVVQAGLGMHISESAIFANIVSVSSDDGGLTHIVTIRVPFANEVIGTLGLSFTSTGSSVPVIAAGTANSANVITIDTKRPVLGWMIDPLAVMDAQEVTFYLLPNEDGKIYMILDGAPATEVPRHTTITVGYGPHTVTFYAEDLDGYRSADLIHSWTVNGPPTLTFSFKPATNSNLTNGYFEVTADLPVPSYRWWFNGELQAETGNSFGKGMLPDGPHKVEVAVVDANGIEQPKLAYDWIIDTQPPASPWFLALDNDNGANTTDRIINYQTDVRINGMAEPNTMVVVNLNPLFVRQTTSAADGTWSVNFPTIPATGPYNCLVYTKDEAGNNSPNSFLNFSTDMQRPRVASIQQPAAGVYGKGKNIEFVVTLDETVYGWPNGGVMSYTFGGKTYDSYYAGTLDGNKLIFQYLVQAGDDLSQAFQAGWVFNGITMDHGDMTDIAGNQVDFSTMAAPVVTNNISMDATAPVISGLPVVADGIYKQDDEVFLDVAFSEPVNVTGVPGISLVIGDTYPRADYVSGSGTSTLRFKYVVPAGVQGHLSVATSLYMMGYTFIRDLAGNTLTDFGPAGSTDHLGVNIDSKPPAYFNAGLSGTYFRSGQQVDLTIHFNEPVTFSGNPAPYVEGMIGGVSRRFDYIGSSSNYATFRWTVPADMEDNDGIAFTNGILGAGLVIGDAAGNIASNTFADSIRFTAAQAVIDSRLPVLVSLEEPADGYYKAGDKLSYKLTFSEPVAVNGAPQFRVDVGGTTYAWFYESGNNTPELIFSRFVPSTYNDADGIQVLDMTHVVSSDYIRDIAGNRYALETDITPLTRPGSRIIIDNIAPVRTGFTTPVGTYKKGDELAFTVTFNEDMKVSGAGIVLDMMIGSTLMNIPMLLQPDLRTLKGTYTVADGIMDTDGVQISGALRNIDGTTALTDLTGNYAAYTLPAPSGALYVDGQNPEASELQSEPAVRKEGETAYITVEFTETVQYTGTPVIYIMEGSTAYKFTAASQPTPASIRFAYAVAAGDYSNSTTADVTKLGEDGGAITDLAGNPVVFTASTITGNVKIDAAPPVITAGQVRSVAEDAVVNTAVGAPVAATELPDALLLNNWTIVNSPDDNGNGTPAFAIDAFTGQITVSDPDDLDYEATPSVSLRIRVSDLVNTSAEQTVTVNIVNANDAPVDILLSNTEVNEDAQPGDVVCVLTTMDSDSNDTFTYSLVTGTGDADNDSFSISGDKLVLDATLDKATKASYSVRIRTTDAGNLFLEKALVLTVTDTSRPALSWVFPAENAYLNAPFEAILQSTEPVDQINLAAFNFPGFILHQVRKLPGNQIGVSLEPLGDADYTLTLPDNAVKDFSGNGSIATGNRSFHYDATYPTVYITRLTPSPSNQLPRFSVVFSEDVTGLDASDFFVSSGTATLTATDQRNYILTVTPAADGSLTIYLQGGRAADATGNGNLASNVVTAMYDAIRPSFTLAPYSLVTNSPIFIDVLLSESVAIFDENAFTVTNGTLSGFTMYGSNYRMLLTPDIEGPVTIQMPENKVQDLAGNYNTASSVYTIQYDITRPSVTLSTSAPAITNNTPVRVTATFTEPVSGLSGSSFFAMNGTVTNLVTSDNITYTFDLYPLSAGVVQVLLPGLQARDNAGNYNNQSNQLSVEYDNVRPVPILSVTYSGGASQPVYVRASFMEAVSGFSVEDAGILLGTITNFVVENPREYVFTVEGVDGAEGTMTFSLPQNVMTDAAGNGNAAASIDIGFDRKPPVVTMYTAATTVTGDFEVTAIVSGTLSGLSASSFTVYNGVLSGFAARGANTYSFMVTPQTDGDVIVKANHWTVMDPGGNGNAEVTMTVRHDLDPPSVTIQAPYGSPVKEGFPVNIVFSEPVTEFAEADITVTNGVVSQLASADNRTFTCFVTPGAEGNVGIEIAAGVARDLAGRLNTAGLRIDIIVDMTGPAATLTSTANSRVNGIIPVTLSFTEKVYGFGAGDIYLTNGSLQDWHTTDDQTFTFNVAPSMEGPVHIDVPPGVAQDRAGNYSTAHRLSFVYDVTGPTAILATTATSPTNQKIPVRITFTEAVVDFNLLDLSVTNGTAANLSTTDNIVFNFDVTPSADGQVEINLPADVVHDAAGNGNHAAGGLQLQYDHSRPSLTLSAASSGPVNTPFTVTATFSENVAGLVSGSFLLTNASITRFTAISAMQYELELSPTADGMVTIQLPADQAFDAATNGNTASAALTVIYDGTSPGVALNTTASGIVKGAFEVTVLFTEDMIGYDWANIVLSNATYTTLTTDNLRQWTYLVTPVSDGLVTIDVPVNVATDLAGNVNSAAAQFSLTADNAMPTVVLSTTTPAVTNAAFPVTVTFTEAVTGFDAGDVLLTNGSITNFATSDNIVYSFTVTPATNGAVTIDVAGNTAHDAAGNGNTAAAQLALVYDPSRPGASITTTATIPVNAAFPVTVTFTEAVTGFIAGDVTVTNGSITNFATSDNIVYTFTVTPATNGAVTIDVAENVAHDAAGNGNTAAAQLALVYDASRPGATITTTATTPVNSAFPVTVTFTEAVTGFIAGDVTITNGSITNFATSDNIVYTFTVTPATNEAVTIAVAENTAHDAAGNGNMAAAQLVLVYDASRPGASITTTATTPVNAAFPVTVTFTEAVSGFIAGDVTVTNGSITNFATNDNINYTFTVSPATNGAVRIDVAENTAHDAAGNGNTAAAQLALVYDASRPGATITTTATTPLNAAFSVTVTFTEAVTGFVAGDVTVTNGSITNFATNDNINYTFTVTPATNGAVTIDVAENVAHDAAGNGNTAAAQLALVYDASRPGATITTTATTPVNSAFPVTVTFTEAVTGFIAGDVTITNGSITNFATSDNIVYTFTVTPATNEAVTIAVAENTAHDAAGNGNTAAAQLAVVYDAFRPGASITTMATTPINAAFPVTVTFTEAVTGFVAGDVTITNGSITNFATSDNIVYTFTVTPATNGAVRIDVAENTAHDAAGNGNMAAAQLALVYDASRPGATITTTATTPVNSAFPVTVTFTEAVTGFIAGDVTITNGSITNFATSDNIVYTFTVTTATNEAVTIAVAENTAHDAAGNGNTAAAQLAVVYDAFRPGASITTMATTPINAAFPVTVTFTEAVTGFVAGDVTITNGSISNFATSDDINYTFTVSPATNGAVTIDVAENVAHDAAGNGNTAAAQLALVYDASRPGASITTTATSPVNSAFPVTVTFTEAVTGFVAGDVTITNGSISNFATSDNISYTFTVTPTADGMVEINVPAGAATDASGNTTTASNTVTRLFDATRPTVTLQILPAAGGGYMATATFSEPVTGLTANAITVSNGQITGVNATSTTVFTISLNGLAEGDISLQIPAGVVSDPAGNGNTASPEVKIYHSIDAPVATITSAAAATVNNTFIVTFTFSKPVSGFSAGDVDVANGAIQNLVATSDRTYTATVIPARDGQVSLFVRAGAVTDDGGNTNAASATLSRNYDGTRPAVTVTTTAIPPVAGAFTVEIRFSEKVTGFTSAWLQLRNATAEPVLTTDDMRFTAVIRPTGGAIEVGVRENAAADAAGNRNTASSILNIAHDNNLPVAVLSARNNPYAVGPFVLTIRLNEPSPDFSAAAIHLENGVLSGFRKVTNTHYTATVTPVYAGPALRISIPANRFSDAAGNRNAASNVLQYNTLQSYTIESVFPNPTTGRFVVKFSGVIYQTMKIQLVSMTGDVVYRQDVAPNSTEVRFDIPASVPDGMYQMMIINGPVKRHNIMLIR